MKRLIAFMCLVSVAHADPQYRLSWSNTGACAAVNVQPGASFTAGLWLLQNYTQSSGCNLATDHKADVVAFMMVVPDSIRQQDTYFTYGAGAPLNWGYLYWAFSPPQADKKYKGMYAYDANTYANPLTSNGSWIAWATLHSKAPQTPGNYMFYFVNEGIVNNEATQLTYVDAIESDFEGSFPCDEAIWEMPSSNSLACDAYTGGPLYTQSLLVHVLSGQGDPGCHPDCQQLEKPRLTWSAVKELFR